MYQGSHVLNALSGGTQYTPPPTALIQLAWEGTSITWEANWSKLFPFLFIHAVLSEPLLDVIYKSILSVRKC